jgi:hypothetical protein
MRQMDVWLYIHSRPEALLLNFGGLIRTAVGQLIKEMAPVKLITKFQPE